MKINPGCAYVCVWQFVLAGGDGVREDMPAERKADAKSKLPGAYIDGVDAFDAAFFGTPSLASPGPISC